MPVGCASSTVAAVHPTATPAPSARTVIQVFVILGPPVWRVAGRETRARAVTPEAWPIGQGVSRSGRFGRGRQPRAASPAAAQAAETWPIPPRSAPGSIAPHRTSCPGGSARLFGIESQSR